MEWTAGYPESFRFLDMEHAEIGAMVAALKSAPGPNSEENPALLSRKLLKKIADHTSREEKLMKTHAYPERELHEKYHQHVIHSIELVLQLFDREGMVEHGAAISKHIQNKISEEIFVDRLFAEFLAEQESRK